MKIISRTALAGISVILCLISCGCDKNDKICKISVVCSDIIENADKVDSEKREIIPNDGMILSNENAKFTDGETVLDVLKRETQNNKLHIDFADGYVKGIGGIYEFDAGEMSGWLYKVNGEDATTGADNYTVQENDVIEWVYICDMNEYFKNK